MRRAAGPKAALSGARSAGAAAGAGAPRFVQHISAIGPLKKICTLWGWAIWILHSLRPL